MAKLWRPVVMWWGGALAWTALICLLMLLPGDDTVAEDVSRFFGGTDLTDAAGHVVLFAVLTGLWYGAWRSVVGPERSLRRTVLLAALLAVGLELVQLAIPHRGVTLLDLTANGLGMLGVVMILARQSLPHADAP